MHLEPVFSPDPVSVAASATRPQGLIFDSAARAAGAYASGELFNPRFSGVLLLVDLSGVGAGESLDVALETFDPVSKAWAAIPGASTGKLTSDGLRVFSIHPAFSAGAAPDGPGTIRSITGTDPAAGAEISETVPADARWRLMGVGLTLVTDATAANREVRLVIDDGTTIIAEIPAGVTQVASETRRYSFGAGFPRGAGAQSLNVIAPLPPVVLGAGYRVRTLTTNLQAGDNYGAPQLLVEEWTSAGRISAPLPPRWRVKATVVGGTVTFSIAGFYLA